MPDYQFTTGPEGGDNTAIEILAASVMTLPSVSLVAGSLFLWVKGTLTIQIGDTAVPLTSYGVSGSWVLYYATGITAAGAIKFTVAENTELSDLRVFAGTISAEALLYYYNDVTENSGDIVSP